MKKTSFYLSIISVALILILGACGSSTESNTASDEEKEGKSELPEDYPNENIDAIVGFEAGGEQDIIMRTVGQVLNSEEIMDQSFVVENKPGAGSRLAFEELKKANDDPYKLIISPEYGPGWDPRKPGIEISDFKPIASLSASDLFIVVSGKSPYETIDELMEALKTEKDLTVATLGPVDGGEAHKWDLIREEAGIEKLNFVPMAGTSESLTAVLGGKVDVAFGVLSGMKDYIETDEIKALAVTSEERSEYLPEVPTLKESEIDVIYTRYTGILAGGNVPDDIIEYWEEKIKEMTETDSWKDFLEKRSLKPFYKGTDEYVEMIKSDGSNFTEYIEGLEE